MASALKQAEVLLLIKMDYNLDVTNSFWFISSFFIKNGFISDSDNNIAPHKLSSILASIAKSK